MISCQFVDSENLFLLDATVVMGRFGTNSATRMSETLETARG